MGREYWDSVANVVIFLDEGISNSWTVGNSYLGTTSDLPVDWNPTPPRVVSAMAVINTYAERCFQRLLCLPDFVKGILQVAQVASKWQLVHQNTICI
jgi:hypothetical protein